MIFEIIIICLASVSAGIFAWLFLQRMYAKVAYYKDVFAEATTSKFSELFLFVDVSKYFYFYLGAVFIVPLIVLELSGDTIIAGAVFVVLLLSPYFIL